MYECIEVGRCCSVILYIVHCSLMHVAYYYNKTSLNLNFFADSLTRWSLNGQSIPVWSPNFSLIVSLFGSFFKFPCFYLGLLKCALWICAVLHFSSSRSFSCLYFSPPKFPVPPHFPFRSPFILSLNHSLHH